MRQTPRLASLTLAVSAASEVPTWKVSTLRATTLLQ